MTSSSISALLTGLNAAQTRVNTTANNIVNQGTVGKVDAQSPDEQVFQPKDVAQASLEHGGTQATVLDRQPQSLLAFDPDSPLANSEGLVEAPNVDLGRELTDLITAETTYKASLKALETAAEMDDEVTDIVS